MTAPAGREEQKEQVDHSIGIVIAVLVVVVLIIGAIAAATGGDDRPAEVKIDMRPYEWDTRCDAIGLHKETTSIKDCYDLFQQADELVRSIESQG